GKWNGPEFFQRDKVPVHFLFGKKLKLDVGFCKREMLPVDDIVLIASQIVSSITKRARVEVRLKMMIGNFSAEGSSRKPSRAQLPEFFDVARRIKIIDVVIKKRQSVFYNFKTEEISVQRIENKIAV